MDFSGVLPNPVRLRFPRPEVMVVQISCGRKHAAALGSDGLLYTWGCGFFGRLGHGDECSYRSPRAVDGLGRGSSDGSEQGGRELVLVACGGSHTAAVAQTLLLLDCRTRTNRTPTDAQSCKKFQT